MTTYLNRSFWTHSRKPDKLVRLDPDEVIGVALHWPGTTAPIGDDYDGSVRRLEGYREYHTNPINEGGRGYTDIAYQVAVDQGGRVWDLRGFEHRSAANGNYVLNSRYGAILVMVGPGEPLTQACKNALRDVYQDRWLIRYPKARVIVGHDDIRPEPTDCPGMAVSRFIDSGYMRTIPPLKQNGDADMILYVIDGPGDELGEPAYQLVGEKRRVVRNAEVRNLRAHDVNVVFITILPSDPIAKLPILQ